jgi:putative membrane protein insertion efficiency factor
MFLLLNPLHSQLAEPRFMDMAVDIVGHQAQTQHQHHFAHYLGNCSNEAEVILTGFFLGYKSLFSSQDSRSCTFEPSCSVYAIETIQKHGLVKGFLDSIDRLTRCNGLSPGQYDFDPVNIKLIDQP